MKVKKRRVMLDGMLSGTELDGSIELKSSEVFKVRKALLKCGAEERDGGLSKTVTYKSSMVVALRAHFNDKTKFFLNVSGNPLTFLRGSNIYGYIEVDRLIIKAYKTVLAAIDGLPNSVLKKVEAHQIFVHSLEFATYTTKLKDKNKFLEDLAFAYRCTWTIKDEKVIHLMDLLDLKFDRKHKDHKSIPLRVMTRDGEEEAKLLVYDKAHQLRSEAKSRGEVAVVPTELEHCLRLDLHLNRVWFNNHSVNKKRLKTLADLVTYVEQRYDGSWLKLVTHEFDRILDRTLLFYMWSFDYRKVLAKEYPAHKNKRVTPEVYRALLKARTLNKIPESKWDEFYLKNKLAYKVDLDPHPEKIGLNMGVVE